MASSFAADLRSAIHISSPAGLGLFPLGVALGLLVIQAGLPWWVTPALSIAAYAGSAEFIVVGLMTAGASLSTIAVTTTLVNFRHIFYAFSFPLQAVRSRLGKTYAMYALTDEAYALTAASATSWRSRELLLTQAALQSYWVLGGLVGVAIAQVLPFDLVGMDFALCALFITLALDACRTRRDGTSAALGALCFVGALWLAPDSTLFVAMAAFVLALMAAIMVRRAQ